MKKIAFALAMALLVSATALRAEETKEEKKWYDFITFKGDFRFRNEMIKAEPGDARFRNRIRARFGFEAKLLNDLDVAFHLASGSDDPVSTNQTLGDAFSTKMIGIDMAYADYHPEVVKGLHLILGKMKNPFYTVGKSELIWDGDLRPEGAALVYKFTLGPVDLGTTFTGFWVVERSGAKDTWLIGAQPYAKVKLMDDKLYILTGGSYYNYTATKGNATFYDNTDSFGNQTDAGGNYLFDFDLIEVFGEIGGKIMGFPVAVFGNFVMNIADNPNEDMAWLVGASFGKTKDPGSFSFKYNYRKVEKDAVLGVFTDSDFIGGGTDGKGHEFVASYALMKHVVLGLNYFYNKKGTVGGNTYNRLMFDIELKI